MNRLQRRLRPAPLHVFRNMDKTFERGPAGIGPSDRTRVGQVEQAQPGAEREWTNGSGRGVVVFWIVWWLLQVVGIMVRAM